MTQRLRIDQMSPQELYQLKQGLENEISTFSQSLSQFRFALDRYQEGKRSIKGVEECRAEEELLMPLSNALYIEGSLNNQVNGERVYLIEYGAGFFVERNAKESTDFYNRKISLIQEKMSKLQQVINDKKEGLKIIELRLMAIIQRQQQLVKK